MKHRWGAATSGGMHHGPRWAALSDGARPPAPAPELRLQRGAPHLGGEGGLFGGCGLALHCWLRPAGPLHILLGQAYRWLCREDGGVPGRPVVISAEGLFSGPQEKAVFPEDPKHYWLQFGDRQVLSGRSGKAEKVKWHRDIESDRML